MCVCVCVCVRVCVCECACASVCLTVVPAASWLRERSQVLADRLPRWPSPAHNRPSVLSAACLVWPADSAYSATGHMAYPRVPFLDRCRRRCRRRSRRCSQRCCRGLRKQGSHEDARSCCSAWEYSHELAHADGVAALADGLQASSAITSNTSWTRPCEVLGVLGVLTDTARVSPAL